MQKRLIAILLIAFLFYPTQTSLAQEQTNYPTYIVQSGDTINGIALRFGITPEELLNANPMVNPNLLNIGAELKVPGIEGVKGILSLEVIPLGETLKSLSIKYQIPSDILMRLNRITSPTRLYAGATLIVPKSDEAKKINSRTFIESGQSLLEVAVRTNQNPWQLKSTNQLSGFWDSLAGESLFYSSQAQTAQSGNPISPVFTNFEISPLPLIQGRTTTIKITSKTPVSLTGLLATRDLNFFSQGENSYVALQGIPWQTSSGLYPFQLKGKLDDGTEFSFEQAVLVQSGGYGPLEKINGVDPKTLDPQNIANEEKILSDVVTKISNEKLWSGMFRSPSHFPDIISAYYGAARNYNNGALLYYHTGIDYGYGNNLPTYAPAAGVVVYTGSLIVRGNATIIDHGWGVFSGIYHQSSIDVQVGDRVQAGQAIGKVGNTGRSTGSHLHWNLWVNGIEVNPLDWLKKAYP